MLVEISVCRLLLVLRRGLIGSEWRVPLQVT